jgi:hypothetical protein
MNVLVLWRQVNVKRSECSGLFERLVPKVKWHRVSSLVVFYTIFV